ncbi:universal stress protein A [Novosphingobium endophyticum]|uniref:Universal stress protein A n=1 Tax=Novosphingobium endophyticum TaxID=1955250 RepID=A0A916X5F2_9SPHN|nr:universal stress protein [Novosphingobium endophyticum]GGC09180.1 universal stress protein A [Novosphingobium endophyticum]
MRDILLQASTYPEPTPNWALDKVAELARRLEAKASLGVCQVHIPPRSNWLANKLLSIDGMIAGENKKSAANAETLANSFKSTIPENLLGECIVIDCPGMVTHWRLAVRARTHDLSVVPVYGHAEAIPVAEGLVFESGRPVLLLPKATEVKFERIAVAWDGSSVATRALSDSVPLLRRADSVTLVQITGEKDLSRAATSSDAIRNLKLHGIDAAAVDVPVEGKDAAATLQNYCIQDRRDLLVMGAFGHSRAREFVLGGVTRSILDSPELAIFISH